MIEPSLFHPEPKMIIYYVAGLLACVLAHHLLALARQRELARHYADLLNQGINSWQVHNHHLGEIKEHLRELSGWPRKKQGEPVPPGAGPWDPYTKAPQHIDPTEVQTLFHRLAENPEDRG